MVPETGTAALCCWVWRQSAAAVVGIELARGHCCLSRSLTPTSNVQWPQLDAVLRALFQVLSQVISPQQAKDLLDTIRVYVMSVNPVVGEEKMNELVSEFWPVQPEPGSVADQLIKKGEARGEARGITKEKVNTIRILQSILGVPGSTDDELADKTLSDLQATIEALRKQIGNRPSE